ncbi:hypothetical protein H9P43_009946 [Blastocladiella emersonii ATCC 22665]|nr:hypothetical protein H9P43_009946 [Blastocladiella emersonii ATCC 22665]
MSSTSSVPATELAAAAAKFRDLRAHPSRFGGSPLQPHGASTEHVEWDERVDSYGGEKHAAMETLLRALGVPGTPAKDVFQAMGPPDVVLPSEDAVRSLQAGPQAIQQAIAASAHAGAPGPFISGGAEVVAAGGPQGKSFLVYMWRGVHDYLYFETDDQGEKVAGAKWLMAGE